MSIRAADWLTLGWLLFAGLALEHHGFAAECNDRAVAQPAPQSAPQREAETQSPADWQRKHGIAIKCRSLGDSYAVLKKEASPEC